MPGIKVVCPAFPADAKGLLLSAIRDPDPVLFLEPEKLYRSVSGPVPEGDNTTPFGSARLVREGSDLTFVGWSAGVHLCQAAAEALAGEGASIAVLDLRSIVPIDVEGLVGAAAETGKVIIVQEAPLTGGFGAEVAATIQEEAFMSLDAPVRRIAAPDTPYPPGALEDHYIPSVTRLVEAAREMLGF
jgi:pyruvate dehydrogenase E1 component beta subunit